MTEDSVSCGVKCSEELFTLIMIFLCEKCVNSISVDNSNLDGVGPRQD